MKTAPAHQRFRPHATWARGLVIALAVIEGGWFLFDGLHAFLTGDYVTPDSGEYAGQLGPWSKLWEAIDIDPRGTLVRCVHVALGTVWLATIGSALFRVRNAWTAMLICAVLGIWYLPIGTFLSVVQIALLLLCSRRRHDVA